MNIYKTYLEGFYFKDKVEFIDEVFNQENLDLVTDFADIKKYIIKEIDYEQINYDYEKACYIVEEFEVSRKEFKDLINEASEVRKAHQQFLKDMKEDEKKIVKLREKFEKLGNK